MQNQTLFLDLNEKDQKLTEPEDVKNENIDSNELSVNNDSTCA